MSDTRKMENGHGGQQQHKTLHLALRLCANAVKEMIHMKLKCRKCGIIMNTKSLDSWQDVADIQLMTCAGGGTHRLVGVK